MEAMERLLQFASTHRTGCKIFKPSDMILKAASDASYLSRPKSGSVAGSFHYLGIAGVADFYNAPISVHSTSIPVICASAAEAEYAGVFSCAKILCHERTILEDIGYPQPPTPIACDNECAVGLANRTVTPKHSKSIDMRFNWVQDRVRQGQFTVHHIPGIYKIADFFTKALPVHRHLVLAPYVATYFPSLQSPNFFPVFPLF